MSREGERRKRSVVGGRLMTRFAASPRLGDFGQMAIVRELQARRGRHASANNRELRMSVESAEPMTRGATVVIDVSRLKIATAVIRMTREAGHRRCRVGAADPRCGRDVRAVGHRAPIGWIVAALAAKVDETSSRIVTMLTLAADSHMGAAQRAGRQVVVITGERHADRDDRHERRRRPRCKEGPSQRLRQAVPNRVSRFRWRIT